MTKTIAVILSIFALTACQSNSSSQDAMASSETSGNSAMMNAALSTAIGAYASQSATKDASVIDTLQDQLSVSPEQAVGGVGALLSLAQNNLGASEQSELAGLIPGMDDLGSSGLVSLISNMDTVNSAFTSLGLDPALISQFAPIIMQGLQSQGASDTLLSGLTSIWQ